MGCGLTDVWVPMPGKLPILNVLLEARRGFARLKILKSDLHHKGKAKGQQWGGNGGKDQIRQTRIETRQVI